MEYVDCSQDVDDPMPNTTDLWNEHQFDAILIHVVQQFVLGWLSAFGYLVIRNLPATKLRRPYVSSLG